MSTVDQRGCRICGPHLSNYADITNRPHDDDGPAWWFCAKARTPHVIDERGVLVQYGKPCETNYCSDCVQHNVGKIVKALHLVEPDVLITINDVGLDHDEASRSLKCLRRHFRDKAKIIFYDMTVFERYTDTEHIGLHFHMYGHGDQPDEYDLARAADASEIDVGRSARRVHVQRMRDHQNLRYFFKSTQHQKTQKAFLDDNGGSLMRASRGFWRIPGQPPTPQGYRGLLREARRAA